MAIADCVVIPSLWKEPFGVVALEAMAMKKAIISSDTGGLPEILDNETAILIETTDSFETKLYMAMNIIISDGNLRMHLAQNAYRKVHENRLFDKEDYFRNFCALIER